MLQERLNEGNRAAGQRPVNKAASSKRFELCLVRIAESRDKLQHNLSETPEQSRGWFTCQKMKFSFTIALTRGSLHTSRFRTWQTNSRTFCTFTMSHFFDDSPVVFACFPNNDDFILEEIKLCCVLSINTLQDKVI